MKTPSLLEKVTATGFRLTAQRRMVIEIIQSAQTHLDAASLLKLAKKREPRINRATVYRTLQVLKRLQLIDELDLMHLDGERHFYELRPERQHVHMACFQCGAILEFNSETLDQLKGEIGERTGFEIQVARLEIGGNCRECIQRLRKDERPI